MERGCGEGCVEGGCEGRVWKEGVEGGKSGRARKCREMK